MPSNDEIAQLAYRLWSARGRPEGSHEEDWLEAERQLQRVEHAAGASATQSDTVDTSLEESFPASDPPASHLPDTPPSNAPDKWAAAHTAPSSQDQALRAKHGKN